MSFSLPHELLMKREYLRGLTDGKKEERESLAEFIESRYPLLSWLAQEIRHDANAIVTGKQIGRAHV